MIVLEKGQLFPEFTEQKRGFFTPRISNVFNNLQKKPGVPTMLDRVSNSNYKPILTRHTINRNIPRIEPLNIRERIKNSWTNLPMNHR